MTNDKAINVLRDSTYKMKFKSIKEIVELAESLDIAEKALKVYKPECGWISCKDKLPDEDDFYIVTTIRYDGKRVVRLLECNKGSSTGMRCDYTGDEDDFIAWMKLPKPYEGE